MDPNNRNDYGADDRFWEMENAGFDPAMEPYSEVYDEQGYEYAQEDQDGFDYDDTEDEGDYSVYSEEESGGRFHMAMNVFDTMSVLMGVVVILALTTLIISIISWLRADITHSFVILQSRIQ